MSGENVDAAMMKKYESYKEHAPAGSTIRSFDNWCNFEKQMEDHKTKNPKAFLSPKKLEFSIESLPGPAIRGIEEILKPKCPSAPKKQKIIGASSGPKKVMRTLPF